uniref:Uncharacterized protein n=1 Tax=Sus scrofa TaxID=9823 RepID=A0A8W4FH80_PIG
MYPMFIAALFTVTKTWKQPKCPSTEHWIKKMKMWYIYTMEYYSQHIDIWNLIYGINEPFHIKETHVLGEPQTCGCQGRGGGSGMDGESRVIEANDCIWSG